MPPKVWDFLRRRFGGVRCTNEWPKAEVGGWSSAATEAGKVNSDGLRRMIEARAIGFLPSEEPDCWLHEDFSIHTRILQFAVVVARLSAGREELSILDFGGAFGTHFFAIRRLLPWLHLDYTVCDLSEFCVIGKKLTKEVRFVNNISQMERSVQLVYASSSCEYVKDWRSEIESLCKASTEGVFVTRTPFVFHSPSFATIQKAYGTELPGWIFNFDEFVEEFSRHHMVVKEIFVNGRGIAVWGEPEQNIHLGILFERK
jgi:putative methyltransferase (TIGR04325 family)